MRKARHWCGQIDISRIASSTSIRQILVAWVMAATMAELSRSASPSPSHRTRKSPPRSDRHRRLTLALREPLPAPRNRRRRTRRARRRDAPFALSLIHI